MRAHARECAEMWLLCVRLRRAMSSKIPSKPKHTAALRITPEQHDAWFALLFTHASVTDRIDRDLQTQHRISFSATEILCRLHDEEPQSVRALADRLVSVSPTRASRLVHLSPLRHYLTLSHPPCLSTLGNAFASILNVLSWWPDRSNGDSIIVGMAEN